MEVPGVSGNFSRAGIDEPVPEGHQKVVEGFAAVLFPPGKNKPSNATTDDGQCVFYNPAQVVNRDLSVCVIEAFSRLRKGDKPRHGGTTEGITILEALSATGLRAIRYWKEVSGVKKIIANDIDKDAVSLIDKNCSYNGISAGAIVRNHDDAVVLMQRLALDPFTMKGQRLVLASVPAAPPQAGAEGSTHVTPNTSSIAFTELQQQEKMDVVDLDPYGTAAPFLDGAVQCAKEGALMLVTCTDSNILCGNYPEKCFANYNGIGIRSDACHEMAVRLVLAAIERVANKHQRYIVPLLSLHIDFYVRVFVRIYTQPAAVKLSCIKLGHVFKCTRCPCFKTKPIGVARVTRAQQRKQSKKQLNHEGAPDAHADNAAKSATPSKRTRDGEEVAGDACVANIPAVALEVAEYPAIPHFSEAVNIVSSNLDGVESYCNVCGGRVALAGPIYCAPTHDSDFLRQVLAVIEEKHAAGRITAYERIRGLVTLASAELPRTPLFYSIPEIASLCCVPCPPTPMFVGALAKLGYSYSQVHCDKSGLKTNAPPEVFVGVMLAYRQQLEDGNATDADAQTSNAEGTFPRPVLSSSELGADPRRTLKVSPLVGVVFHYNAKYDFRSKVTGVAKFIPNAPGWGPKARHTGIKE